MSAFERFGSWCCDWIYTLERLAAERRGLLVKEANGNALAGAVIKRKERPRVRAHRFGLGQLLRARVRPMAGDLPSGYSLAGQSGLVFHVETRVCVRCVCGSPVAAPLYQETGSPGR